MKDCDSVGSPSGSVAFSILLAFLQKAHQFSSKPVWLSDTASKQMYPETFTGMLKLHVPTEGAIRVVMGKKASLQGIYDLNFSLYSFSTSFLGRELLSLSWVMGIKARSLTFIRQHCKFMPTLSNLESIVILCDATSLLKGFNNNKWF